MHSAAVHVSSVGNAQMYQLFMNDGAVHVNLGAVPEFRKYNTTKSDNGKRVQLIKRMPFHFPVFMEQQLANGAPYLRALYYSSKDRACGLEEAKVRSLLLEAVLLFRQGFRMPLPPECISYIP